MPRKIAADRKYPQITVDLKEIGETITDLAAERNEPRSETIRAGLTAWLRSLGRWPDEEVEEAP